GRRVEEHAMTTITVSSNQISAGLTINAGDTLNVLSGGTVVSTTVSGFPGTENIFSGGTAVDNIRSAGGHQEVFGTAIGTVADSGGTEFVSFGGTAVGTFVLNGGFEVVAIGGTTSGTVVTSSGQQNVAGGTAIGTTVLSGGDEDVGFGGTTIG